MTVRASAVSAGATYAGGCCTYTVCGAAGTAITAVLVVGAGGAATGTGTPTTGVPQAATLAETTAATRIRAAFMGINFFRLRSLESAARPDPQRIPENATQALPG
jgi:hypothetical protein